jgi:hypothetical protein
MLNNVERLYTFSRWLQVMLVSIFYGCYSLVPINVPLRVGKRREENEINVEEVSF